MWENILGDDSYAFTLHGIYADDDTLNSCAVCGADQPNVSNFQSLGSLLNRL